MTIQCAQPDCAATTEHPYRDAWSLLSDFPDEVPEGYYCPRHARQLELRHCGQSTVDVSDEAMKDNDE